MTSNVWAVVRREYLQRVRSRWFIATTIGGPLLLAALLFVPAYFGRAQEQRARSVAVVDRTGVLFPRLQAELEDVGYELSAEPWSESAVADLSRRVGEGEIGAFLLLDDETLRSGAAVLYGRSRPSAIRQLTLRSAIAQAALEVQLRDSGVDAAALLRGGELQIALLSDTPGGMGEPQVVMAFVGAFVLYMVILLYAVAVMRATLEEKTSRIVEIVISSMKPWHLMLGKIFGVGAVGLTQMGAWAGFALVLASLGLPAMLTAYPEMGGLAQIRAGLPGAGMLLLMLSFFLFGYFIFSGMYAAVGAMCNTDEEAQQAQFPLVMLIVAPAILIAPVLDNPTSTMAVTTSLVPFFSPILMWARAASGAAPWWQIGISYVLMGLTLLLVAWVAGRIYKVGMLMAGKRPTLPELWRWVREA